jgi:hypothetical protein
MLGEVVSLLCCVAFYGPPIVFLLAPWLVLALALSGPFMLAMTVVIALFAAVALVVGSGALLMAPLLMIGRRRAPHAPVARSVQARMPVAARWVAA